MAGVFSSVYFMFSVNLFVINMFVEKLLFLSYRMPVKKNQNSCFNRPGCNTHK